MWTRPKGGNGKSQSCVGFVRLFGGRPRGGGSGAGSGHWNHTDRLASKPQNVWFPAGRRGAAMITRTLFWVTGVSLWLHRAEGWRELPGTPHPIQEGSTLVTSPLPITPPQHLGHWMLPRMNLGENRLSGLCLVRWARPQLQLALLCLALRETPTGELQTRDVLRDVPFPLQGFQPSSSLRVEASQQPRRGRRSGSPGLEKTSEGAGVITGGSPG